MKKITAVSLCLALAAHPLSALACESPRDVAALKTASLHQRLMVAALVCKSTTAYNRFVIAHRAELQRSDADLKDYFIGLGGESGEAAYDSYKTKVANLAARGPAIDTGAFCNATNGEFEALSAPGGLMQALAAERLPATVCKAPILAAATPARTAKPAAAEEVAGIARARMPAMPYSAAPPPVARMVAENEPIDPADIVPPESYAENERAEAADDYAPPRLAYAPERRRDEAERYDDYAPPPPRFARRGERYRYYRSLYARPRAGW
jgi:hypothetical protein